MNFTRRDTMQLGGTIAAMAGLTTVMPFAARAQAKGDSYKTNAGEIVVNPIQHASMVLNTPGLVIYVDPDGDPSLYAGQAPADLVLITHEHGDHFKPETLAGIVKDNTKLVVNPAVMGKLDAALKGKATEIANGAKTTVGAVEIEAIPAYNITEERKQFHPQGRDNGYVLSVDGKRVYIAGDTEDIPEMRALTAIDLAFVPMNLPFTMEPAAAADAVKAFKPVVVYPYHYRGKEGLSDIDAFASAVGDASQVVKGKWYPA